MNTETLYKPGDKIGGRYQVYQALMGGMGEVYLCFDHLQRLPVALKTFQNRFLVNEFARSRFTQEGLAWIKLEKHIHIVEAFCVEKFYGKPFIVLEMVVGPEGYRADLSSWLLRGPLDLATSLDFAIQFCIGMQHVQQKIPGLVHRDIKPQNILVTSDRVVKITDFGLVKSAIAEKQDRPDIATEYTGTMKSATKLSHNSIVGTPLYMPPEQWTGNPVDIRSDIYSFGCVLYEMFSGHRPFEDNTLDGIKHLHLKNNPKPVSKYNMKIPSEVEDLLMCCLRKEQEKRPTNFTVLHDIFVNAYQSISNNSYTFRSSSIEPNCVDWINQSHSLYNLGYLEDALQVINKVISLNSSIADAWSNKGMILAALGRREEALSYFDRALKIRSDYRQALVNKSATLIKLKQPSEAIACLDFILKANPADSWALLNKGCALSEIGRDQEALEFMELSLAHDQWIPQAWNNRGATLFRIFQEDLISHSNRPETPAGHIYYRLASSLESFLKAIEIDPQYKNAYYNLRKVFDFALESLPYSYQSEKWLWKIIATYEDLKISLLSRVFQNNVEFEIHPRYLGELENDLFKEITPTDCLLKLIPSTLNKLLSCNMSLEPIIKQADPHLILGLFLLNDVIIEKGLLELPTKTAETIIPCLETDGEKLQVAKSMKKSGIMYRCLGDFEAALHCYELGLLIYEAVGDDKQCGHIHFNRGVVYETRKAPGDIERAREAYYRSLTLYQHLKLKPDIDAAQAKLNSLDIPHLQKKGMIKRFFKKR